MLSFSFNENAYLHKSVNDELFKFEDCLRVLLYFKLYVYSYSTVKFSNPQNTNPNIFVFHIFGQKCRLHH